MRFLLHALFALTTIIGLALAAVGWFPEQVSMALSIPEGSIDSFTNPVFQALAVSLAGASIFFIVSTIRSQSPTNPRNVRRGSWGYALQLAFTASVALGAAFLLALILAAGDWSFVPSAGHPAGEATLSLLGSVAVLQAFVGTMLAVVLLFMTKSTLHYTATLAVHLMECTLIGVVVFVGSSI